jgi:N-acetylneuraminate synthase
LETAKEMITTAAMFCKADYVKFQKRSNRELLTPEQYAAPHPNPANSYGSTYGEHRERLEFDVEQHRELMEHCKALRIGYSTSVWDVTSARQMAALEPEFLKVPSASNLHWEMLSVLTDDFKGGIHVSLGMTTQEEQDAIVEFFIKKGRSKDVVLYACTSGYPVAFDDVCLLEISRLKERFGSEVGSIAFSGHHLGIAVDMAAVTLGAEWIERHYTMDRTWKGTDHSASLEPDGLRRLVRDARAVAQSLTYKSSDLLPVEIETRRKLKWEPHQRISLGAA